MIKIRDIVFDDTELSTIADADRVSDCFVLFSEENEEIVVPTFVFDKNGNPSGEDIPKEETTTPSPQRVDELIEQLKQVQEESNPNEDVYIFVLRTEKSPIRMGLMVDNKNWIK
jgi:hypothetical protein